MEQVREHLMIFNKTLNDFQSTPPNDFQTQLVLGVSKNTKFCVLKLLFFESPSLS